MMKQPDARALIWSQLNRKWDVIVIGGGITGAGVFREAVHAGLTTLLVEAGDYASGTSSRSSKLVHGGLRYMKNAQFKTTIESVSEREHLLRQGKGLINRLGFLFTSLQDDPMPGWVFGIGLMAYDLMARQWTHRAYDRLDMRELCPLLTTPLLKGGYRYFDAQTDDARLVLRVIQEGEQAGGTAINYARVAGLLRTQNGRTCGVTLQDAWNPEENAILELQAEAVVNATGARVNELRSGIGQNQRIRPLRGSHLIFPGKRIPLSRAISLWHPQDGRPVFFLPWEGVTLVGTTDIDHPDLQQEPIISQEETEYLLQAAWHLFPELDIQAGDIQGTFSGLRPVISHGKRDPSKESRDHILWQEDGLITIAGGKLTTFRLMARDVLNCLRGYFPQLESFNRDRPILDSPPDWLDQVLQFDGLKPADRLRLAGRYGAAIPGLLAVACPGEFQKIANTEYLWAELRYAARAENVLHLADLLLRRVRLGLLLPEGGRQHLPEIRRIVQPELGWDEVRWTQESRQYLETWRKCYNLPH
ncbi:MAG: glycerol-3-phosphate dehydrogenase/oxidase [Anaerolineales bacterium]